MGTSGARGSPQCSARCRVFFLRASPGAPACVRAAALSSRDWRSRGKWRHLPPLPGGRVPRRSRGAAVPPTPSHPQLFSYPGLLPRCHPSRRGAEGGGRAGRGGDADSGLREAPGDLDRASFGDVVREKQKQANQTYPYGFKRGPRRSEEGIVGLLSEEL